MTTILRSIYTRYMCLYEKYFSDIDALDDDEIARFRKYHEETMSLVKYYYMDIPLDTCMAISEFDNEYSAKLPGSNWHNCLLGAYEDFRENSENRYKGEAYLKAEFTKQALADFYEVMNMIFREDFGTGSQTANNLLNGFSGLLFGGEQ